MAGIRRMCKFPFRPLAGLALCAAVLVLPNPAGATDAPQAPLSLADAELFEKSVRPLLVNHCSQCHSGDGAEGDLRLDSRDALLRGGVSGPAIVPGAPHESLLITAIHYSDDRRMPPDGKLQQEDIGILSQWVARGAPWPETSAAMLRPAGEGKFQITDEDRAHWAFQPIKNPPPPSVQNVSWARTSIDRFILARLEQAGLVPSPPADKRTLIRRATFTLIGLPPTPDETDAFLADDSAAAFERVVDRLLASPHYGERWARHWLDVARYGEDQAHTHEARLYPQGFRYRDWIVRALNDDMPYDEFVRQQIAADLLAGSDASNEHLPALGFFATGPVYYGDRRMLDQIEDRIDTLTRGLLGLTVACARCHDHKFDPISTADYYALAGVIASTEYAAVPLVSTEEQKAAELAEEQRLKATREKRKRNAPPPWDHVHAIRDREPVNMAVHIRGNPENLGEEVPRRFLSILLKDEPRPLESGSGRLELAECITSPDNPLTARVIVNRVWKQHFGRGLVATPSNFGRLGEAPSHPEVLDHLASEFIASAWSLKSLHRAILLSATYQQANVRDDGWQVDPENRLRWRMNRQRLDVEAWRDAILAVAGTLDATPGGPSVDLDDPLNRRRTLYAKISRHNLNPLLRLFDFPDPNVTSDGRTVTTVPLQQLFVLNSDFMVQNAKAFAARVCQLASEDEVRVRMAIERAFGRPASEEEVSRALEFLTAPQPESGLSKWDQFAQVLLASNEFMFVD